MRLRARCAAIFLFSLYAGILAAQVTSSSISGRVYDPSGRVIRQAQVTLEDSQHSLQRDAITDKDGVYSFIGLPPSVYAIRANASGFAELTQTAVPLAVDSALSLDLHLKMGGLTTRIEVSAPDNALQTETASVGAVI